MKRSINKPINLLNHTALLPADFGVSHAKGEVLNFIVLALIIE